MFVSSFSVIVTYFSDVVGSMPVLGNMSLYPWERHLTLISLQDLCVVWKTAQVSASQRHIPEKKKTNNKQVTWYCHHLGKWVWATIALCLTSMTLFHESGG